MEAIERVLWLLRKDGARTEYLNVAFSYKVGVRSTISLSEIMTEASAITTINAEMMAIYVNIIVR